VSRSLSRSQAVVLGAVVFVALGLGTLALFAVGNQQWMLGDTFTISAGFKNVRGVEEGTRVRVQGIDAGEVAKVQLPEAPGGDVMLKMRLHGRFRNLLCADASAQIVNDNMMGGKVVEIEPGKAAERVQENAVIASRTSTELTDLLGQGSDVLGGLRDGKGTLGRLNTDDTLYKELVGLARESRNTVKSIKQDADAMKDLPIVGGYVKDPERVLYRPDCERNRQWFREDELFEPRRAVLTSQGRQKLDALVPWLEGLKHKGSEVVIASFAEPGLEPQSARALTQKQSAAVCDYLTGKHGVQKMGWFSWSRKVTPVGCGDDVLPHDEKDKLPVPRVEVLVFVPQK
jgi:phospholipid/cholesterol/gamma-HCH transport system substrate-binding protein